ncbi:lipoprotein signal peptidase [Spirochaetia bacterium]|nr:lipoprotein signal peptidase [Spirochaetia bacterium]
MKIRKEKLLPFTLTGAVVLADQLVKGFIVKIWPQETVWGGKLDVFNNDLLWILHVRNKAIAFSLGQNLPDTLRPVLFIILPLIVLGFLVCYYLTSTEFSRLQCWAVAGIIGGGLGNIIDRIFRPDGVVDFISVKWFGLTFHDKPVPLLGFDRWPTFNIADSSVVVCCFIFLLSILITPKKFENGEES